MLLTMLPFHAGKKSIQENVVRLRQEIDWCYGINRIEGLSLWQGVEEGPTH